MVIMLASLATAAWADSEVGNGNNIGVGLVIGEGSLDTVTALTGKFYLGGPTNAIDVAIDPFMAGDSVYIQAAYHNHFTELHAGDVVSIPARIGIGGFIITPPASGFDPILAARVPVGLDFNFVDFPLQLFVEAAPDLILSPDFDFEIDVQLGGRWFF